MTFGGLHILATRIRSEYPAVVSPRVHLVRVFEIHDVQKELALETQGVGAQDYAQGSRGPALLTDQLPGVLRGGVDAEDDSFALIETHHADLFGLIDQGAAHLAQ